MSQFTPVTTIKELSARVRGKQKVFSGYPSAARTTSAWIIGQPGMGKSKFIESLVMQDIIQGRAVGLIDIHGDLFHNVRRHVAALTLRHPELARRVVIVDPTTPECTASINPLEANPGMSQERTALFLTDIVIKIWQINPNESPRLVWLLTNTFLALAELNLSLADFPRWLQDRDWRNQHIPLINQEAVRRYWDHEFPKGDKEAQQWLAPATNKLGGILFDSEVRQVLAGHSQITMRQIMDQGLILLVHIPKGILGEKSAFLLGAFIVAQIQKAALSRANTPNRKTFYLYLDEFQNYTTDYIEDVLAESRKYALSLVLAHQFLDQLNTSLRSAVLNTTGTIVSFRVGYRDARSIVHELFPTPDFPIFQGDIEKGSWEKLALELANLAPRSFWVRRRGLFMPAKKRTLDMPDPVISPQLEQAVQRLMAASGKLYGSPQHSPLAPNIRLPMNQRQAQSASNKPSTGSEKLPIVSKPINQERKTGEPGNIYSDIVWNE